MLKLQYFGHLMQRADSLEKTLMLGKIEDRRRQQTMRQMVGRHHRLNGHEFKQTPGHSEGQGSLVYYSSWGHKESDTTERLKNSEPMKSISSLKLYFYVGNHRDEGVFTV